MVNSANQFPRANPVNLSTFMREYPMKFLIVGDVNVGKTSIINRYVEDKFYKAYPNTIGIDFHRKMLIWNPNTVVNMQLWDVAGNDKFRCMTTAFYRNAHGVIVVFDLTMPHTLEVAQKWLNQIRIHTCNSDGSKLPIVLLGNKEDLTESIQISHEEIVKFCEDHDVKAWCTASARYDFNIKKAFGFLIEQTLKRGKFYDNEILDSIKLHEVKPKNKSCCNT